MLKNIMTLKLRLGVTCNLHHSTDRKQGPIGIPQ